MIRVVIRHIDAVDGVLVGDFATDEIDDLMAMFRKVQIHGSTVGTDADYVRLAVDCQGGPPQFVLADGPTPRAVLEVIVEDDT